MNTPRYEFSETILQKNYHGFQVSIPDARVFYSVKCNASELVLKVLYNLGCGFEISSKLEFDRLRGLGVPSSCIICGLPIKPHALIEYLVTGDVQYFVFDDMREYVKLRTAAPQAKKILRIYIKDLAEHCIEYGMKMDNILLNVGDLHDIDGISFHISENTNIDVLLQALDRVEMVLRKLPIPTTQRILNIGGSYELRNDLHVFYEKLNERLDALKKGYQLTVYAEPGAAIVNTAGKVISKVVMLKENDGLIDVYIDAGIPIGVMRPPGYVKVINHNICMEKRKHYRFLDITSLHRPLFLSKLAYLIQENDLLELGDYGAYTLCYRNDFHCWDKPEEVLCR